MSSRPSDNFLSPNGKQAVVFFDFDNTITSFDVLDNIIEGFSIDKKWIQFEEDWSTCKISSRECLEGQLKSIRVNRKTLSEYLATIELDPYFKKIIQFLKQNDIEHMIVSDSFSFIIKEILRHNDIKGIQVYANELKFSNDRLIPSFPYLSKDCSKCAHCKKSHVLDHQTKQTIYIGDGLSDVCPAKEADIVFAKEHLLTHLQKIQKPCIEFKHLGDVYTCLNSLSGLKSAVKELETV